MREDSMANRNIASIVRKYARENPDNTAIEFGNRRLSWRDLDIRSNQAATALKAAGVSSQERIAFLAKNCLEHFEISFAAAKLNAVVVAINWRLTPGEIAYIVNDADAKVLVVGPDFQDITLSIIGDLAPLRHIIAIGNHRQWQSYEAWLGPANAADPLVQVNDEDICSQLYTSGTTGLPKGVLSTNANLFAMMGKVQSAWHIDRTSVNLVCMPLFHIAGCEWALPGMDVGATSVLVRDFDPAHVLDLMQSQSVTNALFVPAMLGFLTRVPEAEKRQFPALRSIIYGASPITDETLLVLLIHPSYTLVSRASSKAIGMECEGHIRRLTGRDRRPCHELGK
jgi:long-chain acyl-CoA synthetase